MLSLEPRKEVGDNTVTYTGGWGVSHMWHPAAVSLSAEQMEGYNTSQEGGTNQEPQPTTN